MNYFLPLLEHRIPEDFEDIEGSVPDHYNKVSHTIFVFGFLVHSFLVSTVMSIPTCQVGDRGYIPWSRGELFWSFPGGTVVESACNAGDSGSIPGLGRSPGGGPGNPLQYTCLENPSWIPLGSATHAGYG